MGLDQRHDGHHDRGARGQIDKLAKKYLGENAYPWANPDKRRLTQPAHVDSFGFDDN